MNPTTLARPERVSGSVGSPPVDPDVSVIVPVTERPADLGALYQEYSQPLLAAGYSCEFVFAVESYYARLAGSLTDLIAAGRPVRVLVAGQTVGEAALLRAAAAKCRGALLVTLPAYQRVAASAIPELIARIEGGADLVIAYRSERRDALINRIQSRIFNLLLSGLAGREIRDVACGVRVMRPEVLEETPIYGDFFRFLPILAAREGFRVEEVPAVQHSFDYRVRVFAPGIYLRRLIDAFGLFFLLRFTEKPLRFFGLAGSVFTLLGALVLAVLFIERVGGRGIADRPMLLLGALFLVLGVQIVALGLIGEIIVHLNASDRKPYRLAAYGRGSPDSPAPGAR